MIPIINGGQVTDNDTVRVVDNYFPKFITDLVHTDLEMMPVAYTNSPYRHFHKSRFFGTMLYHEDKFADIPYYWFVDYFNRCIMGDICKDLNITNCHRVLMNMQLPGMDGQNHTDSDEDDYLTVIYMGHGNSGDTVVVKEDESEQRISFKEGRIVIFKSNMWHRGEAPTEGLRCTLGAVYPLFKV